MVGVFPEMLLVLRLFVLVPLGQEHFHPSKILGRFAGQKHGEKPFLQPHVWDPKHIPQSGRYRPFPPDHHPPAASLPAQRCKAGEHGGIQQHWAFSVWCVSVQNVSGSCMLRVSLVPLPVGTCSRCASIDLVGDCELISLFQNPNTSLFCILGIAASSIASELE